MNAPNILVLAAYILIAFLAARVASDYYSTDKRAQDRPFLMSSRYGRDGGGVKGPSNGGRHVVVAPRTDKFFLASRYGKRSSVMPSVPLTYSPDPLPLCGSDEDLSCAYTGFANLYRCTQKKDRPGDDDISSAN